MGGIAENIGVLSCSEPAIIKPGGADMGSGSATAVMTVDPCQTKYFQPRCGNLENMHIVVTAKSGNINVYLSRTSPNPGPNDYDQKVGGFFGGGGGLGGTITRLACYGRLSILLRYFMRLNCPGLPSYIVVGQALTPRMVEQKLERAPAGGERRLRQDN